MLSMPNYNIDKILLELELLPEYDTQISLQTVEGCTDYNYGTGKLTSLNNNKEKDFIVPLFDIPYTNSIIKDLGEHPEDKKPVRVMKGQYGPYIKYKSLNATIPEEKDPTELTMEEALILIEKRKEYDKNKKTKKKKKTKK